MSDTNLNNLRRFLAFTAVAEVGAGAVLMINPATVVTLLRGGEISGSGSLLGRCFGMALLALGVACWPGRPGAERGSPAFRAMLTYNALIALYLAYQGVAGDLGGWVLWVGVTAHAVVAVMLARTWRDARRSK